MPSVRRSLETGASIEVFWDFASFLPYVKYYLKHKSRSKGGRLSSLDYNNLWGFPYVNIVERCRYVIMLSAARLKHWTNQLFSERNVILLSSSFNIQQVYYFLKNNLERTNSSPRLCKTSVVQQQKGRGSYEHRPPVITIIMPKPQLQNNTRLCITKPHP